MAVQSSINEIPLDFLEAFEPSGPFPLPDILKKTNQVFTETTEQKNSASCIQRAWRMFKLRRDLQGKILSKKTEVESPSEFATKICEDALDLFRVKNLKIMPKKTQAWKSIFFTALKIQDLYKRTHYTFTHAHTHESLFIFHLITEITQITNPEKTNYFSLFFRMLGANKYKNSDKFLSEQDPITSDYNHAKTIMSVDGYLYNIYKNESALFFLYKDSSMNADPHEITINILQSLKLPEEITAFIYEKMKPFLKGHLMNVLQVISIPKSAIENAQTNPVYRAHPFGSVCNCPTASFETLNEVQNIQDPLIIQEHIEQKKPLQWRMLSNIGEVPGVRINTLVPFEDSLAFKEPLHLIVQELFIYKDLLNISSLNQKEIEELRSRIISLKKQSVVFSSDILSFIGGAVKRDISDLF